MIIKEIDYTGCDPALAEQLKKGFAVKCDVWDGDFSDKAYIYSYAKDEHLKYISKNRSWHSALPVKTVKR